MPFGSMKMTETLAFDSTVFRGKDDSPLDLPKARETVRILESPLIRWDCGSEIHGGRCDKLGRVSRLTRAGVRKPESVERAVIKALDWLTPNKMTMDPGKTIRER